MNYFPSSEVVTVRLWFPSQTKDNKPGKGCDCTKYPEKVAPASWVPGKIIEDPDRGDDKVTVILKGKYSNA